MNSAVVFALDVIPARSAARVEIVPIAHVDLTPTPARRHAYSAKKVHLVVLLERTTSRPAETVPSVGTRQPLEFQRSRGVINAVLEGFRVKRERLRHAHSVQADSTRMKLRLHPVSRNPMGPSY